MALNGGDGRSAAGDLGGAPPWTAPARAVDEVITTSALDRPGSRPRNHAAEAEALSQLAAATAREPHHLFHVLADTARALCGAGSAGISLLDSASDPLVFRWRATSGAFAPLLGAELPRHFSPCGVVLDRNATQLMCRPARYYPYIAQLSEPVEAVLLVPFHSRGHPIGTVWVASHEEGMTFDAEHARLVESLSHFAAAAWQVIGQQEETAAAQQELARSAAELATLRRRLDSALLAGELGVYEWDVRQNRLHGDENFQRLFGVETDVTGAAPLQRFLDVIHPDDRDRTKELVERSLRTGENFEADYRVRTSAGERWINSRGRMSRSATGEVVSFCGVVLDITVRKNAERELARLHEAAVQASRAKDDFLAALSHELRTPLNPVLLLAGEFEHDLTVPAPAREAFGVIRQNVELEARLIDDLLDLTKIARGKLTVEKRAVRLHDILQQALDAVRSDFVAKRLSLDLRLAAPTEHLEADPDRLQQVFLNLLQNALKFTPSGGRVTVETENRLADTVDIRIMDTGLGMTTSELARVFGPFEQGDHATEAGGTRFGGLGLGLAIARQLVELHGGEITAASAGRDCGTTITVQLPLREGVSRATATVAGRGNSAKDARVRWRILLVDDHEPTRTALQRLLVRRGHQVTMAATLAEARDCAQRAKFDLVISDIGLPDGDGATLMRELRANSNVRGIALTGYGTAQDVERSIAAGFFAHLTKPVRVEALDAALTDHAPTPRADPAEASPA